MLRGDLFDISSLVNEHGKINATLEVNPLHAIFAGHFPGQPVVPGVCMLQMIKEVAEKGIAKSTRLVSADHLKFLSIIDPGKITTLYAELKYSITPDGTMNVIASLVNGPVTFFKMNGHFVIDERNE